MKIRRRYAIFLVPLLFLFGSIAIYLIAQRFTSGHNPPDWRRELARQLGIDTASTASLQIEFPPIGTRSLGAILTSDTHSLVHLGTPERRAMHRVGWGTARIALSSFRDANGRLAVPYLSSAVEGKDSYDVEVELDSAAIVEISRQDLRSYVLHSRLSALPEAESALLVERVLEARVSLIVARGNHASRAVWVRDSAEIAQKLNRPGGWLVLNGSSRDSLRFQTPERVVMAFATVPLCRVARCVGTPSDTAGPSNPEGGVLEEHGPVRPQSAREPLTKGDLVTVHIFIDPPQAVLRIDGEVHGAGNRSVALPAGRHVFEASTPGYVPAIENLVITRGMPITLELTKQ